MNAVVSVVFFLSLSHPPVNLPAPRPLDSAAMQRAHKGGRWYGKTKNGKFMTEADAVKAGYREAKTAAQKGK